MIILLKKNHDLTKPQIGARVSFKHFSSVYTIMMFISYSIHYMILYYRTKNKKFKKKCTVQMNFVVLSVDAGTNCIYHISFHQT